MPSPTIALIGRSLQERADQLVESQLAALREHPHYSELRELDLRNSARRNVRRAVVSMGAGDLLDGPDHDHVMSTVLHVVPGLAPEQVVSAFRTAMAVIRDAFLEEARQQGVSSDCVIDGLRALWELTDQYGELLATAHSRTNIAGVLRRNDRLDVLARALVGELDVDERERLGPLLGLEPDTVVTVFRLYTASPLAPAELAELHRQAIGWPTAPLVATHDVEVCGLVRATPRPVDDPTAILAVSAPVGLADLPAGFRQSGSILATARRFGLIGVVDARRMGLRPAILAVPRLSEGLYERYVRAVYASTPMAADLLHTVEVFLTCQRRFQRAAQELNMHVNSLRHRLERYREITGADLAETEVVAEVWWALQHRRAAGLENPEEYGA
jgi:hypothetical protein